MQEQVYSKNVRDTDELRERIIEVWARVDQSIIGCAIKQWRIRLACVKAAGGHFEQHKL